jgi:hypothetical protein
MRGDGHPQFHQLPGALQEYLEPFEYPNTPADMQFG